MTVVPFTKAGVRAYAKRSYMPPERFKDCASWGDVARVSREIRNEARENMRRQHEALLSGAAPKRRSVPAQRLAAILALVGLAWALVILLVWLAFLLKGNL